MEQNKQTVSNETEVKKNDNLAKSETETKKNDNLIEVKKPEMEENKHIVKLSKAYKFEDEGEVSEIDLSCLKDATADVLMKTTRVLTLRDDIMTLPESDIRYALFIASECTKFTYEFYKKLNFADATKVKRVVQSFFNNAE